MVEQELSKLLTGVRFPLPAHFQTILTLRQDCLEKNQVLGGMNLPEPRLAARRGLRRASRLDRRLRFPLPALVFR